MLLEKIYAYIPHILISASIFVMLALFILGRINLLLNSMLIFIPCIGGSLYLIISKKRNRIYNINYQEKHLLNIPQKRIRHIFLIVAIAVFLLLLLADYTSPLFLILMIILYLLCLLQIISKDTSAGFVLFSILYTTFVFVMPLFITNQYFYYTADTIFHTQGILSITNSGIIPTISTSGIYGVFYGMYLFIGIASVLSGIAANASIGIFMTLAYICVGLFTYLLSKQLFKSKRIGLLATYFYFILSISYSGVINLTPYFLLILLGIMIIYLIIHKRETHKLRLYIIVAPIIAFSMIAHHANHIPMILILMSLLIIDIFIIVEGRLHKEARDHTINIQVIIMYFVAIGAYLYYNYMSDTIKYIISAMRVGDEYTISSLSTIAEINYNGILKIYSSYIAIIVFLILIGLCTLLTLKKRTQHQYLFALFILIFFILFVPGVADSLPILGSLQLYRWRGLLLLFFSIAIAFGLFTFVQNIGITKSRKILLTLFILITGFSMLLSPIIIVSANNMLLENIGINNIHMEPRNAANNHFTDTDMAMMSMFSEIHSTADNFASDRDMTSYITIFISSDVTNKPINDMFMYDLFSSGDINQYNTVLFRKSHFDYCGFWRSTGGWDDADARTIQIESNTETNTIFNSNIRSHNCIYQNGDNIIYQY